MFYQLISGVLLKAGIRYPEPQLRWSNRKYELRSIEIDTYSNLLQECLDNYNEDPRDRINDFIMMTSLDMKEIKPTSSRLEDFNVMLSVAEWLNEEFTKNVF